MKLQQPILSSSAHAAPAPAVWSRLLATLSAWRRHAHDRAVLRQLDSRQLRDIGLSDDMIERETAKPFWRA